MLKRAVVWLAVCAALLPIGAPAAGLVGVRASAEAPKDRPQISAVHVENRADGAVLTFDLSQSVDPVGSLMVDPDRVVIDMPQVDFGIGPQVGKLESGRERAARRPMIGAFRFGLLTPGRSRIVVDLTEPAQVVELAVRHDGAQSRLVLRLAKTTRAAFLAAARTMIAPTPAVAEATQPATAPGKPTIVIDPGHGGPDTGAIVGSAVEKDVTLAFSKALASRLEASGLFNVVMTRASDEFIPLSERVRIARTAGAALMVSVHADTLPETADVSGATVYTVSDKASDAYAAKVAAKENEADAAVGVTKQASVADVNDILFDLTRQETRAYSHVFARTLINYWKVVGHLNKNPRRSAGFVVLKAPDVPSVLLELGYLSNAGDAASLTSEEWRVKAADRMAEAVEAYFADQRGPAKAAAGIPIPIQQASVGLPTGK